jgi:hypothetical protein
MIAAAIIPITKSSRRLRRMMPTASTYTAVMMENNPVMPSAVRPPNANRPTSNSPMTGPAMITRNRMEYRRKNAIEVMNEAPSG